MNSKAEHRLRHPAPGSAIEAAREFGIDLTLLIERLRLSPEDRLRALQQAMTSLDRLRGAAKRSASSTHD